MKRKVYGMVLFWVLVAGLIGGVFAREETVDTEFPSLRGLDGMLIFAKFDHNIKNPSLTKNQIKSEIKLALERAGIKVLSGKQLSDTPGMPVLYAKLLAEETGGQYVYSGHILLQQLVTLVREPEKTGLGTTWISKGFIGTSPKLESLRPLLTENLNEFINAYFSANPKNKKKNNVK